MKYMSIEKENFNVGEHSQKFYIKVENVTNLEKFLNSEELH